MSTAKANGLKGYVGDSIGGPEAATKYMWDNPESMVKDTAGYIYRVTRHNGFEIFTDEAPNGMFEFYSPDVAPSNPFIKATQFWKFSEEKKPGYSKNQELDPRIVKTMQFFCHSHPQIKDLLKAIFEVADERYQPISDEIDMGN